MNAAKAIYVRTTAGRIHKAAVVGERVLTDEACNLDEAPGPEQVLERIPEEADVDAFCRRCFPGEADA